MAVTDLTPSPSFAVIPNARPTPVSKPFLQAWGVGH